MMMSWVAVTMLLLASSASDQGDQERREAAAQTQASGLSALDTEPLSYSLIVKPERVFDWEPQSFLTSLREHPEPSIRTPRDDLRGLLNEERSADGFCKRQRYTVYSMR